MPSYEQSVINIVRSIVPQHLKTQVQADARLTEDLMMDSVQLIGLATHLELEMQFDVLSSNMDLSSIKTIRDIVQIISQQKAPQK